MKKTSIFFAIATIALLSACRKENFNATESTPGAVTVIGVGINDVKTTMGAPVEGTRKIYWANGDVLQANGLTSAALADLPEECTSARFTFDGTLTYPANLLYPADYYKDESTITLPLEQPVTPKVALYGYMDKEGDAQMNALLAYVHIPLTQGEDKDEIKAMTVESLTDGYCLSGDFTIDYETGALTPAAEASKKVSVLFNKPLDPEKATDFFAAVPAGENVKLSVKFRDSQGHCMTKTVTRTFAAGKVVSLPETEFVPTTTEFDVVITTAEQFVKFAEDYNKDLYDHPIVALGADIVFNETTSASFRATGGIGYDKNGEGHFNGTIDGQNHKISGLINSTVTGTTSEGAKVYAPLFYYTGGDSYIKNIVLDSDCQIKCQSGNFGAFVGHNKGTLENCTCNAQVNLCFTNCGNSSIGGLVGYNRGTIKNCTMAGKMLCSAGDATKKTYKIGCIAGSMSNNGEIENCTVTGLFNYGAATGVTGPSNPNAILHIGGIVGSINSGTVKGCTFDSGSNAIDWRGKNGLVYGGGVAGYVTADGMVSDCKVKSHVYLRMTANATFNNGSPDEAVVTGSHIGGFVGYNAGTVTGNTFTGAYVTNNSGAKDLTCGGIVGLNDGTITNSSNTEEVKGGSQYTFIKQSIGGIVGRTTTSLTGLTNSGTVQIPAIASEQTDVDFCIGGIAGEVVGDEVTIKDCSNSGIVQMTQSSKTFTRPNSAVGGIVGRINGVNSKMQDCTNTGDIINLISNNNIDENESTKVSGIVAHAIGTAAGKLVVSGCKTSANGSNRYYGARGYCGGIVGYANNVEVSNAEVTMPNTGNLGYYAGGVAGALVSSSVTSSSVSVKIVGRYVCRGAAGGIAAKMDGSSSIKSCNYLGDIAVGDNQATVATKLGGVVGESATGSEIADCGFKGTIKTDKNSEAFTMTLANICSDTNFTDGGGNHIIED